MSATAVPLVTIGGDDGRAAVVVKDDVPKVEGAEVESHTSVVPNQPAPGPDVFERPEGQQSQSAHIPPPRREKEEEAHEVTTGEQKLAEKADSAPVPPPPPPPQAQQPPVGGAVHEGEKETAKEKETPPAAGANQQKEQDNRGEAQTSTQSPEAIAQSTEEGPKGQAEVERDRVMEELFGEPGK